MCTVVLEVKDRRLRFLTESNREVNLSANRLAHTFRTRLDLSMGRNKMVDTLKEIVGRRNALINNVDIKELWESFKYGTRMDRLEDNDGILVFRTARMMITSPLWSGPFSKQVLF